MTIQARVLGRSRPKRCGGIQQAVSPILVRGLRRTSRETWTRHLAEVAWGLRDSNRERATDFARATLEEDKRYIAKGLESNHLFIHWNDWHAQQWVHGLGVALALSQDELSLTRWVSNRCEALPLSAWDAEDNHEAFSTAQEAAQHWFLVAMLAVEPRKQVGRAVDPAEVRTLAEWLFTHCHFAMRYLRAHTTRRMGPPEGDRRPVEAITFSDSVSLRFRRRVGTATSRSARSTACFSSG